MQPYSSFLLEFVLLASRNLSLCVLLVMFQGFPAYFLFTFFLFFHNVSVDSWFSPKVSSHSNRIVPPMYFVYWDDLPALLHLHAQAEKQLWDPALLELSHDTDSSFVFLQPRQVTLHVQLQQVYLLHLSQPPELWAGALGKGQILQVSEYSPIYPPFTLSAGRSLLTSS